MRYFAFLTMLLSTSLAGSIADAADPVTLKWKLKVGDTFYIENVQKMKTTTKVMDNEVVQNATQTAITQFSVTKVTPDGGAVLQQTVLNSSSKSDRAGSEDTGVSELIKGVTFTITLNGKHEIVKFEGYDEFVKKVSGGKTAVETALRAIIPEENLKKSYSETFSQFPGKAVSTGEMWNRTFNQSMGPIGNMAVTAIYEYVGKATIDEKPVEHITYVAALKYSPPKAEVDSNLPFTITKGNFKSDAFSGTIHFDSESGRIVNSVMNMKFSGDMTFLMEGESREVSLKSEMTIESRVLDKNPLDE
ncbi:MAG: hypothetical protein HOH82_15965 [Planctomycetaceae bacterium]|nr:hypothetical protein [Planctomycetaceae bacterium]